MHTTNLERVQHYLSAIESGATGEALAMYFSPDVVQEEFPNRLLPQGARRDLAALLDGAARGQKIMAVQRFRIRSAIEDGDRVALEMVWTGKLKIAFGAIPAGGEMRAHIATFIEFKDGLIVSQRSYDCFEEW